MKKVVLDVPNIKQLKNHCGPASLAMVFQYYGYGYTQEKVAGWFEYNVTEFGMKKFSDIMRCAKGHGFVVHAREYIGLEGIIEAINNNYPLIAIVNSEENYGCAHAVVVCGYELNPNNLWLNDPLKLKKQKVLYRHFANRWRIRRKDGEINQYGVIIYE